MSMEKIILASASPRRRELLAQMGMACEIVPADIDETQTPGETPRAYVQRMAREKASIVFQRHPERAVLAADTTVVLDGQTLGKPVDRGDARAMLGSLSGRSHEVMTAICLLTRQQQSAECVVTEVEFCALDEALCEAYLDSDEPWDKAGGYGIQGLAGVFVKSIRGSYSNVVGLPLHETWSLLRQAGIPTPPEPAAL